MRIDDDDDVTGMVRSAQRHLVKSQQDEATAIAALDDLRKSVIEEWTANDVTAVYDERTGYVREVLKPAKDALLIATERREDAEAYLKEAERIAATGSTAPPVIAGGAL